MTDMKRLTISLPDELADKLEELKQTEEFKNAPYSKLIRAMIQRGLDREAKAARAAQ